MYHDNRSNPIEFQGHRSKVKVISSLVDQVTELFSSNAENVVVDNAVFRSPIGRSREFFWYFCVHNTAATRGQYLALSKA